MDNKKPADKVTRTTSRAGWRFASGMAGLFFGLTAHAGEHTGAVADFSLEELINLKVTSVSKKEQNLFDAATAVTVISNEDLRRSGVTSIPEALRLVPGLDVAAVNSSQWAVSSRGHNSLYANKLLVLVDGRVVYNPNFAGVYWDLQQTMLEDVDRIEVIRGPGATIWGANAVNGVINVTTRNAKDTQGGLIYGGGGDVSQAMVGGRYGRKLGTDTYYRIFAGYELHDDYPLANGLPAGDNWQSGLFGFRLDHDLQADTHLTWQADLTGLSLDDGNSDAYNVNTLGRWTRELSDRSGIQAQIYYDRTYRNEILRAGGATDTIDITTQHSFRLGGRNELIWGLGAQFIQGKLWQLNQAVLIQTPRTSSQLYNVFIQDELQVVPDRLTLTGGTKLEHNSYTGFEFEPSLRAVFKPTPKQSLWAAVSRAVRTPSVLEGRQAIAPALGAPFVGPGGGLYVPRAVGNANIKSEILWAYEVGYRIQPTDRVSLDVAAFYHQEDQLQTWSPGITQFIPGSPLGVAGLQWGNYLSGHSYGTELSVQVSPLNSWHLTGGYSLLVSDISGLDPVNRQFSAPKHQASLRSSHDFTPRLSLDAQLRYVGGILGVSAYITGDVRLAYRLTDRLELSAGGQNLMDGRHMESSTEFFAITAEVPRSFYGKITWKF